MTQRDPLQVLGLGAGASRAEITAAYRKLARRHHPDSHPHDSPAQRRRREAEMADINAAHQALVAESVRSTPPEQDVRSPRAHSRPRVPPPPPPRPAADPSKPEPLTGDPVSPWRVLAVLAIATVALLASVGIAVAVIAPDTAPAPTPDQPQVLDVESWTVGTCLSSGSVAEPVRCEFPNRGRVTADVFAIDQCPAGTDAVASDPPRILCIDFEL